MNTTQIYQLANEAQQAVLGETSVLAEDWSNLVDIGGAITDRLGTEAFYNALVNQIGKMFFVTRPYKGKYQRLFRDSWEFGSIVGKVQAELLDATENESWKIVNGASYDPYTVSLPVVTAKFFNQQVTFEIDLTTPIEQIEQSFKSPDEMTRFLAMLEVQVNNSMELKIEALTERAVCNLIGATVKGNSTARVRHLVTEYNSIAGTSLTSTNCLVNAEFLRFAVGVLLDYKQFLAEYSVLYNEGGKARHTPNDLLHIVVNSVFAARCKTHLASVTYHDELVQLPNYEEVAKWQGTGLSGTLQDRTTINATLNLPNGTTDSLNDDFIIAAMFDHDAVGILQPDRKVTSAYNPKAEYYNSFHKWRSRFFNDFNENCVVFMLD